MNRDAKVIGTLSDLYIKQRGRFPWISFLLVILCSIISLSTWFNNELYNVFCLRNTPFYWWQFFIGNFEHSIYPKWFFWAHYLGNMSVIILPGVLLEKVLGNRRMFTLSFISCIANSIAFQLMTENDFATGSGVSGIVWSYAPIALYIIIIIYKGNKYELLKDGLFYGYIFEFFFMWIFVTAVSSWKETNIWHMISTVIGFIFLLIWRMPIKKEMLKILTKETGGERKDTAGDIVSIGFMLILMILSAIIINKFYSDNLGRIYTHELGTSDCATFKEIEENNGSIAIYFDSPVENYAGTSTYTPGDGYLKINLTFSTDKKTMFLHLEPENFRENETGIIKVTGIKLKNKKTVQCVTIEF